MHNFLHNTPVVSFYIVVVLTLSIQKLLYFDTTESWYSGWLNMCPYYNKLPYRNTSFRCFVFRIFNVYLILHCAVRGIMLYYGCLLYVINSLSPGRLTCHFKTANFNLILLIGIFTSSKDNALRWMPRDLTDDKSTLVQIMAWCHQATSHYLSQCCHMVSPGHN